MFLAEMKRAEFLGIVQGERVSPRGIREREFVDDEGFNGDMLLVWPDRPEPDLFPSAVILREGDVRDFLAWVATYVTGFRPFTAFCRVTDIQTAARFTRRHGRRLPRELQSVCLGMILGEAAAYIGETGTGKGLSVKACSATYSYVLAKSLWLGANKFGVESVGAAWNRTRDITHQNRLRIPVGELQRAWSVVGELARSEEMAYVPPLRGLPSGILEVCFDLYHKGVASRNSLEDLGHGSRNLLDLIPRSNDTREGRVIALEIALQNLSHVKEETTAAFLAGFLVSQVAPGTMEHLGLLKRWAQSLPSAYVWYGLCAALQRPNNLVGFGDGLGRRMLREVVRNEQFLDEPKCDIALQELELVPNDQWLPEFRSMTASGQLDVELEPCVVTSVRLERHVESGSNVELFPSQISSTELLDTVRELDMIADRVARTRDKLNQIAGGPLKKSRKR